MFKVTWDKKRNIVLLKDTIKEFEEIVPPRIVFTDELRLLGIDRYSYSSESVPVCWCIDRRYFYKGDIIFEAKGGDLYSEPLIIYPKDFKYRKLEAINIDLLYSANENSLQVLQNEAMDFIEEQYKHYNLNIDAVAVAFSGGKDSQVVLDLVSKVIPPAKYKAYYTDTGMELPCTYNTVEKTTSYYKKKYPSFSLVTCSSEYNIIDQWKKYGPPSRMNRWCCKVRKTSLFVRKLKDEMNYEHYQPKCLVFEGVRADESVRRESYERVGKGVKHVNLINCRPIFNWNDTEIYLYILCVAKIDINEGYKKGLTRIGCNICPFASSWSEFLINKLYPEVSKPFIEVIEKMAKNIGLDSKEKIDKYISSGNWKKNAGGKGLMDDPTRMDIISKEPDYECVIHNPKQDWKVWMNTIGNYVIDTPGDGNYIGSIKFEDQIMRFSIKESEDIIRAKMYGTNGNVFLTSYMNKVLRKTAFCERCGVCEAECPTGALVIRKDKLSLDTSRCIHCHNCYNVNSYGCILASRKMVSQGGNFVNAKSVRSSGVDRYSTFGLRESWVSNLFAVGDDWFLEYKGLGPKMVPAANNWFRDAEIMDPKDKKLSDFGREVQRLYNRNPFLAWQIIWINLCFNSYPVQCYVQDCVSSINYRKSDLITLLQYRFPDLSETTLGNPAGALINMFKNSPFGCEKEEIEFSDYSLKMGVLSLLGKESVIKKVGTDNISHISICYLLYKIAEKENRKVFTLSELNDNPALNGPKTVFNISDQKIKEILRGLTELGYINADLLGGLDNITINNDINAKAVLSQITRGL